MPAKSDLHVERMLEKVTWDWQPVEPLVLELIPLVPPGKALRKYEERAARSRARNTGEGPTKAPLTPEEKIQSGARQIVRDAINTRKATRFEIAVIDGVQCVRFRSQVEPGDRCPTCGHEEPVDPRQPSAQQSPKRAAPRESNLIEVDFVSRRTG